MSTAKAPYSKVVRAGNTLYVAGHVPRHPVTGEVPDGIEAQTRLALQNLESTLAAAGARLSDVVKTTVFLTRNIDFDPMNTVYAEFFTEAPPARTALTVTALGRDGVYLIEIEAVAHVEARLLP